MMRTRYLYLGLIFVFLLSAAGGNGAQGGPPQEYNLDDYEYVEDQLLVSFKPSVGSERSQQVLAELGVERIRRVEEINLDVLRLPPGLSVEKALEVFSRRPEFKYVEPNFILRIAGNLEVAPVSQWNLDKIQAQAAWDLIPEENRTPILIAVVDTGIDSDTPELVERIWKNQDEVEDNSLDDDNNGFVDDTWGWDFANNDNDPMDDQWHGSAVSSVIASDNDGQGITGVCPWCQVMAVKVMTAEGTGSLDIVANGITYAVNNGAQVINLSLAGAAPFGLELFMQSLKTAVDYAWNAGVLVVAAAGNNGINEVLYPAGFQNALSVGSTNETDGHSCFSNYADNYITVSAPGEKIPVVDITKDDEIVKANGTSVATPHVAGLAGLLLSYNPSLTNVDLRERIKNTAIDLGPEDPDAFFGHGRIDAVRALNNDTSETTSPHQDYVLPADATAYAHARKLARSSDGTLHLVWYEQEDGEYKIQYAFSTDDGSTWSQRETIFSSPAESYHPAIAVDNENIYVVFPTLSGASKYQIKFSMKPISGGSWSAAENLMGGTYNAVRPDIYLDPSNNKLHVVASSFDDANYAYYRSASKDETGLHWSGVVNVDFQLKTRYATVYAYGQKVYIASRITDGYMLGPTYYVGIMRSFNGGVTWQDRSRMDGENTGHTDMYSAEYGLSMAGYQDTLFLLNEWDGQMNFRRHTLGSSITSWQGSYLPPSGSKWPSVTASPDGKAWVSYVGATGQVAVRQFQGGAINVFSSTQWLPSGSYPNFENGTNLGEAEWVTTYCDGSPFSISYNYTVIEVDETGKLVPHTTSKAVSFSGQQVNTFTLSYSAGLGGSLSGDTTQIVNEGTNGTPVTAVPNPGYSFDGWSDGSNDNPRTDTNVTADVSVTANFAINDPPTATGDSYTTNEDTALSVPAPGVLGNDSDPENDTLTVATTPISPPSHGSLTLNTDGSFSYTPNANYNGPDSFVYQLSDGNGGTDTATVTITVASVNDPPTTSDDAYTTDEDVALTVAAPGVLTNDSDVDGDPLTAVLVAGPEHGTLAFSADGSFTFTPAADYFGQDSFTYHANDTALDSNIATVTITVTPVNDAPVALDDDAYSTAEDTPLTVAALGVLANDSDVDGDPLTAVLVAGTEHGTLAFSADGSFTFTPAADYFGQDSFTYHAYDTALDSNIATVTITVNAVNDSPVANDDIATTNEDTAVTIDVRTNDSDVDGNTLVIFSVTQAAKGTVVNNGTNVTYTPDADFNGSDNFTYTISDGNGGTDTATVSITVNPLNDAPVAADNNYTSAEDTPLTVAVPGVLDNDSDAENNQLTAVLDTGPANGMLTLNADGAFMYTPNANFNGTDSFTYHANDGMLDSNVATVTITVNALNDAPVAVDDAYSTDEDTALSVPAPGVLSNDSDVDGDLLSAALLSGPEHGILTLYASGHFIYNPSPDYTGPDSFSYRVFDSNGGTDTATVSITVNAVPTFVDITADADIPVAGTVAGLYTDTHSDDGIAQSITERESGGKPSSRYSYLEHKWVFNVTSGNVVTFYANAWRSDSSDDDSFKFEYATDDDIYKEMFIVDKTEDVEKTENNPLLPYQSYILPAATQGTVYIRVVDSDQTSGNQIFDTITIDHLFIRTVTQSGAAPVAPSGLTIDAVTDSQIDLSWTDNSDDETGFHIERSLDGSVWSWIASVGANETIFPDTGLEPKTIYYYRVQAFNGAEPSAFSNTDSATTLALPNAGTMHIGDLAGSTASLPRSRWEATVTITVHDQDHSYLAGVTVSGNWSEGGTASCVTDFSGQCSVTKNNLKSSVTSIDFEVTTLELSGSTYDTGSNHKYFVSILSPL